MSPLRPDVVFDCNIFLQGLTRRLGQAAEALRRVERNEVTLYVSRAILRELRTVLDYPEIREKNPAVTDEVVEEFVNRVMYRGVLVRDVPHTVSFPRDPNDEPYLDLIAVARADYLVTRDRDLLDLATSHYCGCSVTSRIGICVSFASCGSTVAIWRCSTSPLVRMISIWLDVRCGGSANQSRSQETSQGFSRREPSMTAKVT